MSLLGSIVNKILHPFGGGSEAQATESGAPASPSTSPSTGTAPSAAPATTGTIPTSAVDVEQVLNDLAAKNPQQLNWRTSIVDLLKLLGIDSSLKNRQELADELHYTGDKNDSATLNVWLHKQVLKKLAENGGKVPQDLLT